MLMCKNVGALKVSVIYIYIYIYRLASASEEANCLKDLLYEIPR